MATNAPYIPLDDPDVERALGQFIIVWGSLERTIDSAIHDLMATELRTSATVTANMAIRAKLDLVHALFETLRSDHESIWRPLSKELEARFDSLVNRTAQANAEVRIQIVHSQPSVFRLEEGDQPLWVRWAARNGGLRGSAIRYSPEYLDTQIQTVVAIIHDWADMRDKWRSAIQAIRSADADAWLSRSPDDEDRLSLQIQSIPDSAQPKPKQPRQPKPSRRAKREARERGE